jgi:hypothetical protein
MPKIFRSIIPFKEQKLHTLKKNNISNQNVTEQESKPRIAPKNIYGSSSIKQMRKEWRNDLIQIHNKLDHIEIELEKLERLCRQLNNLLGSNDNEDNSFSLVVSAINNIKRNFIKANDNVTQLKKAVDTFKLEDNSEYKKLKKKNKHHEINDLYNQLAEQTNSVSQALNNTNVHDYNKFDEESEEESDIVSSVNDGDSSKKASRNDGDSSKKVSKNDSDSNREASQNESDSSEEVSKISEE